MSSLLNRKPRPAQYIENGHDTALRDGNAFQFDMHKNGIAAGASVLMRFVTGSKAIFFEQASFVITQEELLAEVFEDPTFSAPGTLNNVYSRNMNRIMNKATQLNFYDAPAVSDNGESVMHQTIVGTAGQSTTKPGFGSGGDNNGRVFKPNTEHLFKVTNNSVDPIDLEAHIYYREVDVRQYS